jgi:hypothetical protein
MFLFGNNDVPPRLRQIRALSATCILGFAFISDWH